MYLLYSSINKHDYSDLEDQDSEPEFEDDGPDLFEPLDLDSPLPSPIITPQRSSPPLIEPSFPALTNTRTILPSDQPSIPPLISLPAPKKFHHTVGARIQALLYRKMEWQY